MKKVLLTVSLLVSAVAFSAEQPKGLGQFDPTQCGCETCFTKYGVCTAVNQGADRKDLTRDTANAKRGKSSKATRQ